MRVEGHENVDALDAHFRTSLSEPQSLDAVLPWQSRFKVGTSHDEEANDLRHMLVPHTAKEGRLLQASVSQIISKPRR